MASLQYTANSSLMTVTLGSAYTSGSGTMTLTTGHGARLPASGDFWLARDNNAGTVNIFKVTARSSDTLTVVADATEGSGDANLASGTALRWALTVSALTQLRADIVAQGGLVLLQTQTASSSASLSFTSSISSTYDTYLIKVVQVIPATDNVDLYLRFSTDGGSTYDSGANYSRWGLGYSSGASGTIGGNSQNQIKVGNDSSISNSSSWGICAELTLFNPGGSAYKFVEGTSVQLTSGGSRQQTIFGAAYESSTAVNAFQFSMSSGNIASGTIRVYGVAKS